MGSKTLLLLALAAAALVAEAVPASRFNRKIDEKKLEEDLADEESDDWHEDTHDWKRKQAEKRRAPLNMAELQGGDVRHKVLQHEASGGGMQMAFATIKESVTKDPKAIEEIGKRWQGLLATNGVQVSLYPIGGQDVLFTEDNGRILEVRDFVLAQPEAEKFRWKDTDFTPTPTPKANKAAAAGGSGSKSKGKGKAGSSSSSSSGSSKKAASPSAKPTGKGEEL